MRDLNEKNPAPHRPHYICGGEGRKTTFRLFSISARKSSSFGLTPSSSSSYPLLANNTSSPDSRERVLPSSPSSALASEEGGAKRTFTLLQGVGAATEFAQKITNMVHAKRKSYKNFLAQNLRPVWLFHLTRNYCALTYRREFGLEAKRRGGEGPLGPNGSTGNLASRTHSTAPTNQPSLGTVPNHTCTLLLRRQSPRGGWFFPLPPLWHPSLLHHKLSGPEREEEPPSLLSSMMRRWKKGGEGVEGRQGSILACILLPFLTPDGSKE